MKLYIITINEVCDFVNYDHAPVVCFTLKDAKKELAGIFKEAKAEYKGEEITIERGKKSFSVYADHSWSESHYEAVINEVDVELPAPKKKFRLDVIFGEEASRKACEGNPKKVRQDIASREIDGACETYKFSTEEDRDEAICLLEAADGWMGNFWEKSK